MHHVAVRVGHDLQLDMARAVQVFLDIHRVVAEAGPGLGAGDAPGFLDLVRALGHLHAAAAAAGGSLDQHRIADPCGDRARLVQVRHHTVRARHQRYAERGHGGLGLDLVAHHADMRRRGTDEGHAVRLDLLGEAGVLRQEAVAGVDGVRPGDGGSRQDVGNVEIGIFRRRRADADAFIGQAHMHRLGVGGGMHRDGGNAEFAAGALDAKRDLAAIGDQDLLEQWGHSWIRRPAGSALRHIPPATRCSPGRGRPCRPSAP